MNRTLKPKPLASELLRNPEAWWRAANILSADQTHLYDNPNLGRPLKLAHIKPRLLGHWGTTPGLVNCLASAEQMSAMHFHRLVNHESGLIGVSETSSDMRDLLAREASDIRAAEAVALFCYQAKKWISSFAAAIGGLGTPVFASGIGVNCPSIRARICDELDFLHIESKAGRSAENEALISEETGRVAVRVIRTDEARKLAGSVCRVPGLGTHPK